MKRTASVIAGVMACVMTALPVLAASAPTVPLVAFTRHYNVYLMTTSGRSVTPITSRGTGYPGILYPAYSWSPDGRYLLLEREYTKQSKADLLLLSSGGKVLRTLAAGIPAPTDFWPGWAIDANQIAFISADTFDKTTSKFRHRVERVDTSGHRSFLFSYSSFEGCGGGSDDPSELAYWNEVGYEGNRAVISWSLKQHLAAYQSSCAGGVNVTNTQTGLTGSQPRWIDPALSAGGSLAVSMRTNGSPRSGPASLLIVDPGSGTVERRLGVGELAAWTADGHTLYFVRRALREVLRARDTLGNRVGLSIYRSAIVDARGDGRQTTLFSTDAYGFGPLNVLPGAAGLVFSQIDNAWALWRAGRNGVLPTSASPSGGKYAPAIAVRRLDTGKAPITLATNAGSPAAP